MRACRWFAPFCAAIFLGTTIVRAQPPPPEHPLKIVAPADGAALDSFLAVELRWEYPQRPRATAPFPFLRVNLQLADNPQFTAPLVNTDMDDHQTSFRA